MSPKKNSLQQRAADLRMHGILDHWSQVSQADWLQSVIAWEEEALRHCFAGRQFPHLL